MASAPVHVPSPSARLIAAARPGEGEPAWDVAKLFPLQGHWSESDYLKLNGNYLVEFAHGHVEVLPMPTPAHQKIVAFLFEQLLLFVRPAGLGTVLFAPFRVRVVEGKYREPDVVFVLTEHAGWQGPDYWDGADLVMEVVSDDFRKHDLETKRFEYARAGIPEYWIVDPMLRQVTVLRLAGDRYEVHGVFKEGERATSALLAGFAVDVSQVFAAAEAK